MVMKKGAIFVSLILLSFVLVGTSIFVSAVMADMIQNNGVGPYEVNVRLEKGWNLIAGTVPSEGGAILLNPTKGIVSEIQLSDIKAMWHYSPLQGKYIQVHPNTDWNAIMQDDEDLVLQSAMWLYSDKEGWFSYSTLEDYPSESRALFAGWNLVSMTPDLLEGGKYGEPTLQDISGNCNIEKVYYFVNGNWKEFDFAGMERSLIGRGLAMKVTSNCVLEYAGSATAPPTLPGESGTSAQECTDSDGLDYYTKGTVVGSTSLGEPSSEINDGCIIGGPFDGQLREAICQNGLATWAEYKCPNGCSNGVCI